MMRIVVYLFHFGRYLLLVLVLLAVVAEYWHLIKRGLEMMRTVVYLFHFGRHLLLALLALVLLMEY